MTEAPGPGRMGGIAQPAGTVTLVFTDIEGSTRLLSELGQEAYREALAGHRQVIRETFARYRAYEVDSEGDAFFYAFASATDAVRAVGDAMAGLAPGPIRIRVGVHTGEPGLDPPKYVGMDVHRAARIMAAACGGQVVLSLSTRELVAGSFGLRDLGEHRLKDFPAPERLFQLGEGEFPPLRTLMTTTLPAPATIFLGREREVSEVAALLQEGVPVLTLAGPAGTGKTRLALQAATVATQSFPDGLWWVPLAPLRDPSLLLPVIAQALHVKEQAGSTVLDTLVDRLAGKRMLVLLDNVEQLLPAAATVIAALRKAPGPTLLSTSRECLRLQGEHVYAVPPLVEADAVELFSERARLLDRAFAPTVEVRELCARLDNLPLALELAAARTMVFSPAELLERLGDRLDLLRGSRDTDPRQQTMRATLEWSFELIAESEKTLFARLSVFAGSWSLAGAEDVCDASVDGLESLIDKSLVRRQDERYSMLVTIRELASEKLEQSGEGPRLRDRLARFLLALATRAAAELEGPEQAAWFDRLEREHNSFRAVLDWAHEQGDGRLELELSSNLARLWLTHGHLSEGSTRLDRALAAESEPSLQRAKTLEISGFIASRQGRHEQAEAHVEEGAELAASLGESREMLRMRGTLAGVIAGGGDLSRAGALIEADLPLTREFGGAPLGVALVNLAEILLLQGDPIAAEQAADEAVETLRSVGNPRGTGIALGNLGLAHLAQGKIAAARRVTDESLELWEQLGDPDGIGRSLSTLGAAAVAEGDAKLALLLLSKADALFDELGTRMGGPEGVVHERARASACSVLGDDRSERLRAEGAGMGTAEAILLARTQPGAP